MKRRVEAGQPALSGMFTRAEVTYAWPRPDGTVGSDREPVALFTGEAVHAYLGHLSDETVEAMLNELSIGTLIGTMLSHHSRIATDVLEAGMLSKLRNAYDHALGFDSCHRFGNWASHAKPTSASPLKKK